MPGGRVVSDHFLTLNGVRFHYRDWGGAGQPVVLLHGLASTSHIWNLVAPHLGNSTRVVALDQRGHGDSEKPETGYDFIQMVVDVRAFVQALGLKRPVVVGHSWGGNVALEYAVAHPQECAALVLVDGGFLEIGSSPEMTWERTQELLAPPEFTGVTREALLERVRQWGQGPLLTPEVEQIRLANFFVDGDGFVHPQLPRERHMEIVRALWEQRPSELYSRVTCSVLLVPAWSQSTDERTVRFEERKRLQLALAQRRLPRSLTVAIEETVHDVPLHKPRELAQVIGDFVREHS